MPEKLAEDALGSIPLDCISKLPRGRYTDSGLLQIVGQDKGSEGREPKSFAVIVCLAKVPGGQNFTGFGQTEVGQLINNAPVSVVCALLLCGALKPDAPLLCSCAHESRVSLLADDCLVGMFAS